MEYADLKNKTDKELNELLSEKREDIRDHRFKASERQLKDVRKLRTAKRDVARILTILNTRKQEVAVASGEATTEKNNK